jgi:hypothetical protein
MKLSKILLAMLAGATCVAHAQALYKYVDANGKVTYSDRQPKPGEKATPVNADPTVNVISSATPSGVGSAQRLQEIAAKNRARENQRNTVQSKVDVAAAELENAKKALEDGRTPREDERRIIVGKTSNAVLTSEAYAARIASLEAAVKTAEEKLEKAKQVKRDTP